MWRRNPWSDGEWYERFQDQSIELPSAALDDVCAAAAEAQVWVALGITERTRTGTLDNVVVYINRSGATAGLHRKLVPTSMRSVSLLSELPRRRRATLIASVGGVFLVLAITSASWVGFVGAATVLAAAVAAGVKGFEEETVTLRHYESYICDSARWEGFEHRLGDIVVTTPPKCGRTWMQMCCLVLVHGAVLPDRLSSLAPWLDQTVARIDEVRALFEAQPHRRVIKTHTPLDGLLLSDLATYVAVGRDPRDVAFSSGDHFRNMDVDALRRLKDAAGLEEGPPMRRPHSDDREQAFLQWVDDDTPVERFGSRLSCTVHHLRTVWARRRDANVELFHYADLRRDPEGQLRRLAAALGIDVPDDGWPALVEATSLASMKQHADDVAPNAAHGLWHDTSRFFAEGRQGSWRTLFSDDALAHYERRLDELCPESDLRAWLHHGWTSSTPG